MDFDPLNRAVMAIFGEEAGGETVSWPDTPARVRDGVFDSRHFEAAALPGEAGVSELTTTLTVVDDPDDPIAAGERLTVRGGTYKVKDQRPDGQGMTVLELEVDI